VSIYILWPHVHVEICVFYVVFKVLVLLPFSMASQYPRMDSTMHIPIDILPEFEALKIAL
jgi:hypothetical protein